MQLAHCEQLCSNTFHTSTCFWMRELRQLHLAVLIRIHRYGSGQWLQKGSCKNRCIVVDLHTREHVSFLYKIFNGYKPLNMSSAGALNINNIQSSAHKWSHELCLFLETSFPYLSASLALQDNQDLWASEAALFHPVSQISAFFISLHSPTCTSRQH